MVFWRHLKAKWLMILKMSNKSYQLGPCIFCEACVGPWFHVTFLMIHVFSYANITCNELMVPNNLADHISTLSIIWHSNSKEKWSGSRFWYPITKNVTSWSKVHNFLGHPQFWSTYTEGHVSSEKWENRQYVSMEWQISTSELP